MRIISGKYRGRVLRLPKNLPVRPTTDFAKEALFNILNNKIDLADLTVLDLFAGTGNISLELLSREVTTCTSVDLNFACISWLQEAKKQWQIPNWQITKEDALKFVKRCSLQYDFILADPPYDWKYHQTLVDAIFEKDILKPDGLFILEHGKTNSFKDHVCFQEVRDYGAVHFSFFSVKI